MKYLIDTNICVYFLNQNTKQGKLIDDFDILIAAVALSNDMIPVTNNEKHFERISGLTIENWL